MMVRPAQFGNEVLKIADLMCDKAKGRTELHLCRSRADQLVKRSKATRARGFRAALVAIDDTIVRGFLYAEERHLFDLFPHTRVVEVPFLVGGHGAALPLLTRLREMTKLRILVQSTRLVNRPQAFERLLRPLHPQKIAVTFQV